MPNRRCRMHGGKSLVPDFTHPTFKHGYYSRSVIERLPWDRFEREQHTTAYVAKRLGKAYTRLTTRGLIATARDMDNGRELEAWQAPYAEIIEAWNNEP